MSNCTVYCKDVVAQQCIYLFGKDNDIMIVMQFNIEMYRCTDTFMVSFSFLIQINTPRANFVATSILLYFFVKTNEKNIDTIPYKMCEFN